MPSLSGSCSAFLWRNMHEVAEQLLLEPRTPFLSAISNPVVKTLFPHSDRLEPGLAELERTSYGGHKMANDWLLLEVLQVGKAKWAEQQLRYCKVCYHPSHTQPTLTKELLSADFQLL